MSEETGYRDLHAHIEELKKKNLLICVEREIDKDTEMHPLVRWQFVGGVKEEDRKAFLFTNICDGKGRKYHIPVIVGGIAANREIYATGMDCKLEDIPKKWSNAIGNAIL
ncbi:MAG: hypothetical protein ACKVIF_00920, partial [Rhodospirillales bacterium]